MDSDADGELSSVVRLDELPVLSSFLLADFRDAFLVAFLADFRVAFLAVRLRAGFSDVDVDLDFGEPASSNGRLS